MSVTVLGMGGTIDKDYPRSQMGYAFEIDEPAAKRILENLPHAGIDFDVVSVCRKDSTVCFCIATQPPLAHDRCSVCLSQEITNDDRDQLVAAVRRCLQHVTHLTHV